MSQMSAYRIQRFGGPEVVERQTIDIPSPSENQVLVRVDAASVNPVELKTREGAYPLIREDRLPYTLGRDCSGKVERVGAKVTQWQEGDEVYGFVGQGQGTYAEFVVMEANALAAVYRSRRSLPGRGFSSRAACETASAC